MPHIPLRILTPYDHQHLVVDPEDWSDAINAMMDELEVLSAANPGSAEADWRGIWPVKKPIYSKGRNAHQLPGTLVAMAPMETVLIYAEASHATFGRKVRVKGTGSANYAQRTCKNGVEIHKAFGAEWVFGWDIQNFRRHGLWFPGAAGMSIIDANTGLAYVKNCGATGGQPGSAPAVSDLRVKFTGRYDDPVGAYGNVSQQSRLPIDFTDPFLMANFDPRDHWELGDLIMVGGQPHMVLEVHPTELWVGYYIADFNLADGEIISGHGCALSINGGNTTNGTGRVSAIGVGTGIKIGGLYNFNIPTVTVQNAAFGLQEGSTLWSEVHGFVVGRAHLEAVDFEGVKACRAEGGGAILDTTTYKADKWRGLTIQGPQGDKNLSYKRLRGLQITEGGITYENSALSLARNQAPGNKTISNRRRSWEALWSDDPTIPLDWVEGIDDNFTATTTSIDLYGANGGAPGSVTFEALQGTVDGGPTRTIDFTSPVRVLLTRMVDAADWRVNWILMEGTP